jgi:hypothetical protein
VVREQEKIYQSRIENVERHLHPSEGGSWEPPTEIGVNDWNKMIADQMCCRRSDLAASIVNLAVLFHQQGKYREAAAQYEKR